MQDPLTRSYFYRYLSYSIKSAFASDSWDEEESSEPDFALRDMLGGLFGGYTDSYRKLFREHSILLEPFDRQKEDLDDMSRERFESMLRHAIADLGEGAMTDAEALAEMVLYPKANKDSKPNGRTLRAALVKELIARQEAFIDLHPIVPAPDKPEGMLQTFLSYSYKDRGLSLCLFFYFWMRGGYLYVDWMHNGRIDDGDLLRENIDKELGNSSQLLFLRSLNSELNVDGGKMVRQWCAWEIGNFYCKHPSEFYYCGLGGPAPTSEFLSSFSLLSYISGGLIQSPKTL